MNAVPKLLRHVVSDTPTPDDVSILWRNVQDAFDRLFARVPILNGQLLASEVSTTGEVTDGVALSATAKLVAHGLGRPPRGWLIVRSFGANAADVRETARDARTITLVAASACTVYLWVWG